MAEEEYEYFEMEVAEEDIVCYLVDEDDNEVGFVVLEDGKEVEYFYADEEGVEYEYVEEPAAEVSVAAASASATSATAATTATPAAPAETGARESRIKPLSSVTPEATSAAASTGAAPKDGIDQATDKVIETIKSDGFKTAARDFGAFAQETADATKELRDVYKDVKETIDMFNPKNIFK